MAIYISKPTRVTAVQFTGTNWDEMDVYTGSSFRVVPDERLRETVEHFPYESGVLAEVYDLLHDTWIGVKANDYIIHGTKGEFYPCDPEVFKAKYEPERNKDEPS